MALVWNEINRFSALLHLVVTNHINEEIQGTSIGHCSHLLWYDSQFIAEEKYVVHKYTGWRQGPVV
jgi:hypothetical protein